MIVAIPARLNSTRLPRKMLLDVGGKPLIWHTIRRALESSANAIFVLTEDQEIFDVVTDWQIGRVLAYLTPPANSGTEKVAKFCCEVLNLPGNEIVINLQGDEPLVPGRYFDVLENLLNDKYEIATLATPTEEPNDPDVVKVVRNHAGQAMYFSRSPIPYGGPWLKHIGVYAYPNRFLRSLRQLKPTAHINEKLEQLQWLESCQLPINVLVDNIFNIGVDTQNDYDALVRYVIHLNQTKVYDLLNGTKM